MNTDSVLITGGAGYPVAPESVAPTKRRRWAWVALIGAFVVAAYFIYGVHSRINANPDPFNYSVEARRLLAGQKLYVNFFSSKPPLSCLLYAIPCCLAPRSYLAVSWFLATLLLLQAGYWIWAFRPSLTAAAVVLLVTVMLPAGWFDSCWTSPEHLANLFIIVVLAVSYQTVRDQTKSPNRTIRVDRLSLLLAGAAVAAAFHIRQSTALVAAVPLACILAAPATWRQKFKAGGWLCLGGLSAWLVVLAVVCLISDVRSYFYYVFVFPRRLAATGASLDRLELLRMAARSHFSAVFGLCAGIAMVGPHRLFAGLLLVVGAVICLAAPIAHPHYWVTLFPFLVASFSISVANDDMWTRRLERVALATVFVITLAALSMVPLSPSGDTTGNLTTLDDVAALVNKNNKSPATLAVFAPMGAEYIQFRSKLMPANKYAVPWDLDMCKGAFTDSFEGIVRSYIELPPTCLVIHKDTVQELAAAQSKPQGDVPQSVTLLMRLIQVRHYREVGQLYGFHIGVLDENPGQ